MPAIRRPLAALAVLAFVAAPVIAQESNEPPPGRGRFGGRGGAQPDAAPPANASASATTPAAPAAGDGLTLTPTWGGRAERARTYDLIDVRYALDFDLVAKKIAGEVTNTIAPIANGLREAAFDSEGLTILGATVNGKDAHFQTDPTHVIVALDPAPKAGESVAVTVRYEGSPTKGLYWVSPEPSYPDKPYQAWTQGEDMDNHFWLPTWDYPNDRATYEAFLTCKDDLVATANGLLVDVKPGEKPGTKTWHYRMAQPNVTYLIALAIGPWERYADEYKGKPVEYFVNKGVGEEKARRSFGKTPAMLEFFESFIGVGYPWDKYAQVAVTEFIVGGMENVSNTLQTDRTLHDERSALDRSSEGLVAHELAHQWFGDLLTCRDWTHLWLNEGFATYFQVLFAESQRGVDDLRLEMRGQQQGFIRSDGRDKPRPMVSNGFTRIGDEQNRNVYTKGSSVLHMLRFVLGDEAFRTAIRHYTTKHAGQLVDTRDFQLAINEATGQPLDWFFEQWVTGAGYPKFEVRAEWDESTRTETLRVKQTQTVGGAVPVFRMPVDVKFVVDGQKTVRRVWVHEKEQSFSFPLEGRPELVRFDDGGWIAKTLDFEKTVDEWVYQLEHDDDIIGRLEALDALAAKTGDELATRALARCTTSNDHKDVREDAATALGKRKDSTVARGALLAATRDAQSKVRAAAARGLASFEGDDEAYDSLRALVGVDPSYSVQSAALRGIRGVRGAASWDDLVAARDIASENDSIRSTANDLIAEVDPSRATPLLLADAAIGRPSSLRQSALSFLSRRAKDASEADRAAIVVLLEKGLDEKSSRARRSAISGLGDAYAKGSLARLKEIAEKDSDERVRGAAKSAVEKIEKGPDAGAATAAGSADPKAEIERLRKRVAELERRGAAPAPVSQ